MGEVAEPTPEVKAAEPTSEVKAAGPMDEDKSAEKRKEVEGVAESDTKRQKTATPDQAVVRKQVEYYLSDENLKHDKFFHEKITSDKEGWLDISLVLSCNKMKAMRATKEDVIAALKESKIEMKEGQSHIRRPNNAVLPSLAAKPQHFKKNQSHAHDGGVVCMVRGVPAEQSWTQVKDLLNKKLEGKGKVWHVSEVGDDAKCNVVCPPFEGDAAFFQALDLELGGAKLTLELCFADALQQVLRTIPKHIREKREKEARRRQKERNRPFVLANQKFVSIGALRGKIKEIMNSRSDGEALKAEGTDFKLIRAVLEYHPKGAEKTKDIVGLKVAPSTQGDNRCFYMVRADNTEEDVSIKKCLDAVEANPPYVTLERKPTESSPKSEKATTPKSDTAPGEADKKTEAAPVEEKKLEEKTEKTEEKKIEEKAEAAPAAAPAASA